MRVLGLPVLLGVALVLAATPVALADQEQGSTVGLNLGFVAPGVWDLYRLNTAGGLMSLSLTWAPSTLFPFADYDLRLYRPNAFNDANFNDNELVAQSSQHPYAHHSEQINVGVPAGNYWIAVAPFQAQGETYTLSSPSGNLVYAGTAFGYMVYQP